MKSPTTTNTYSFETLFDQELQNLDTEFKTFLQSQREVYLSVANDYIEDEKLEYSKALDLTIERARKYFQSVVPM